MPSVLQRAARAVLRSYPRAWRERYGVEVSGMLDERGVRSADLFDLARGAIREQLWPTMRLRDSIPALSGRSALAGVASLLALVTVSHPLLFGDGDPVRSAIHFYIWPERLIDLWLLPFAGALAAFLGMRLVGSRAGQVSLAVAVLAVGVASGLSWMLTEASGWPVLIDRPWFVAGRLAPHAVAFLLQSSVAFAVLNRRAPANLVTGGSREGAG